jgi:hypothetical protein
MSLLVKALRYRKKFLKEHKIGSCMGLLKRVILYLKSINKKNNFFETFVESQKIETSQKNQLSPANYSKIVELTNSELSKLPQDNISSFEKINKIISKNFNITKSALLIFSPNNNKFLFKCGINLDNETKSKLSFDIKYNNIFKRMIKSKSYIIYPDSILFKNSNDIISDKDLNESDFQLFVPYIFSDHVIGVFLGLKLESDISLVIELITSLEKVCKSNGDLLYNLIQNTNE